MLIQLLAVFIGGGIGSLLRWAVCLLITSHWGTMCVNLIGAFVIGMAYQYFATLDDINEKIKLFIMTGLLGGFTTFSTYLLNFITLYQSNQKTEGLIYLILSVLLGCLLLVTGMEIIKRIG